MDKSGQPTREQQLHAHSQTYINPSSGGNLKAKAARAIVGLVNMAMSKVAQRAVKTAGDPAMQADDFLQQGALGALKYLDNIAAKGQTLPDVRTNYLNVSAAARGAIERPLEANPTALRRTAEEEFLRERGTSVTDTFGLMARREREDWLHDRVLPGLPLSPRQREALLLTYETLPNTPEMAQRVEVARQMGITSTATGMHLDKALDKVSRITHIRGVKPGDTL